LDDSEISHEAPSIKLWRDNEINNWKKRKTNLNKEIDEMDREIGKKRKLIEKLKRNNAENELNNNTIISGNLLHNWWIISSS